MEGDDQPAKTKYNNFEVVKRNMSCGKPPKKDPEVWDPPSPKRKPIPKQSFTKQTVTTSVKMPSKPTCPPRPIPKTTEKPNPANKNRPKSSSNPMDKK